MKTFQLKGAPYVWLDVFKKSLAGPQGMSAGPIRPAKRFILAHRTCKRSLKDINIMDISLSFENKHNKACAARGRKIAVNLLLAQKASK